MGFHITPLSAGILFVPYRKTKEGFESTIATNYLGHFLLTHLLMPQLVAGGKEDGEKAARIINVSSCANEAGSINYKDFNYEEYYHAGLAYADSKLAQVLSTRHLDKLCQKKNWKVQVHAAHPGLFHKIIIQLKDKFCLFDTGIVDTEIYQGSIWGSLNSIRKILFKVTIYEKSISRNVEFSLYSSLLLNVDT